jgi:hypothetical protein
MLCASLIKAHSSKMTDVFLGNHTKKALQIEGLKLKDFFFNI